MRAFQDRPIKEKLTLLILLSTSVVLVLVWAAVVTYDWVTIQRAMRRNVTTLGATLAESAASYLQFTDKKSAHQTLATLRPMTPILSAAIFDDDRRKVAEFRRPERGAAARIPEQPGADGLSVAGRSLALFRATEFGGMRNGTLYLQYDMQEAYDRRKAFSGTVAAILLAGVLMVLLVTNKFQRFISEPIVALANTARVVSEQKDYSLRVVPRSKDEVGFLIERFNEMLAQIETSEKELRQVNEQLAASEKTALAATQAKSAFLANMSHELRTPSTRSSATVRCFRRRRRTWARRD